MTPFPLFLLPIVPFEEILKYLNPWDIIKFCQCSKKAAKQINGNQNFGIFLDFQQAIVTIKRGTLTWTIPIIYNFYDGGFTALAFPDSHYPDKFTAVTTIGLQLSKVCFPLKSLDTSSLPRGNLQELLRLLVKQQPEIRDFTISDWDEDLKESLNMLKITGELHIESLYSSPFQYNFIHIPKIIKIGKSFWFNINNALATNCVILELNASSLSNQNMDLYLRKWQAGDYPNLEYLNVKSRFLNNRYTIVGMQPPIFDPEYIVVTKKINNSDVSIQGGVPIQRNDGVEGLIKCSNGVLSLIVFN